MTRTRLGLVGRGLGLGIGLGTLGLGLGSQDMRLATRPIVECVSNLHIIFATEHVRRAISHGLPGIHPGFSRGADWLLNYSVYMVLAMTAESSESDL